VERVPEAVWPHRQQEKWWSDSAQQAHGTPVPHAVALAQYCRLVPVACSFLSGWNCIHSKGKQ